MQVLWFADLCDALPYCDTCRKLILVRYVYFELLLCAIGRHDIGGRVDQKHFFLFVWEVDGARECLF
jgi:hypothetical protein